MQSTSLWTVCLAELVHIRDMHSQALNHICGVWLLWRSLWHVRTLRFVSGPTCPTRHAAYPSRPRDSECKAQKRDVELGSRGTMKAYITRFEIGMLDTILIHKATTVLLFTLFVSAITGRTNTLYLRPVYIS
jgi:hypothetical protein